MAKQNIVTVYKVFIASPGDTEAEAGIVQTLCAKFNQGGLTRSKNVQLRTVGWKEIMPQAGDPREIIRKLAAECDLLICLLHKKLDIPALEGFLEAYAEWKANSKPQIFLFFKPATIASKKDLDNPQFMQILEFKDQVEKDHIILYKEFKDEAEFSMMLETHLDQWLCSLPQPAPEPVIPDQESGGKGTCGNTPIIILFLAADPSDQTRLRTSKELEEIREMLQKASTRDRFRLETRLAARAQDVIQALLDLRPQIVHFAGHGTKAGELCFEDDQGKTHPVGSEALADLFRQFADSLECVVLNACYAEQQARAIAQHIGYVVGMRAAIGDKAARYFAASFYQGLGGGKSIEAAFELGQTRIKLENHPHHNRPVLIHKGVPPEPAPPLPEPVLVKYREYALQKHSHLPIQGFETSFRHPVLIERVYVKMRAHLQVNDCARTLREREDEQTALREQQIGIVDLKGALAAARRHQIKDLVILGDPGAGKTTLLKYITVMLLQGQGEEKLGITEQLIPFLAPLRELRKPGAESFCSFLARVCKFGEWGITKEAFRALLDSRQGLILLDGLDEVADKAQRLAVIHWIDQAREECVYTPFIVTSRFAGYFGEYQLGGNILPLSIQAFTDEEIGEFLGNWFTAVEECLNPGVTAAGSQGQEKAAALAEIIRGNENLRSFVTNPLLLQITALVYRDRGSLPERRIDLYRECTKILLGNWDKAKGLEVSIRPEAAQQLLQPVALWLHRENDRRYAPLTEVLQVLKKPLQQLGKGNLDARQLLENIRDRSGVFVGYTEEDYGFIHLTFQEYLAAEEIHSHRLIDLLVANYSNKWWREVILLTMALDNPSLIEPFLEQVVRQPVFLEDITLVQDAIRDSQVKPIDVLLKALEERKVKSGARQRIINLLQEWEDERITAALRKLAQGKDRAVVETAYAVLEKRGQAAGLQPDREEAGERERVWAKDQAEMVLIPAGVFLYGSREDDKEAQQDEKPQRSIELPAFWMDRYPVTNRQYCLFLNEAQPGKQELEKWIYLAGKYKKEKCRIEKKGREYLVESDYGKYPVIYVTWYGASAYARWAGKELPTEQQWEKAARGTDGRKYPWGNEWKEGMCNSWESGIRMTTPVEKYPEGKSVYGCYDMAGNVWEWTDSKYSKTSSSYVVRGGAWVDHHGYCRCAYRIYYYPDSRNNYVGFRCART